MLLTWLYFGKIEGEKLRKFSHVCLSACNSSLILRRQNIQLVSEHAMKVQPLYRLSYPTTVILCSCLLIRATRITTNTTVNRQVCAYIAHYLSDRNCCEANAGAGNETQEYSIAQCILFKF